MVNDSLQQGANNRQVVLDTPEWYEWLKEAISFTYEGKNGNFTLHRRERAGGWYWYAYRRVEGKLQTLYAGKATDLSHKRLEEIARELNSRLEPQQPHLEDTKLYLPQSRQGLVLRSRLLEKLDKGRQLKLILLIAPPGYGKTTLLAEWAKVGRKQIAWLSLDESDNDPARFIGYLVAALEQFTPTIARGDFEQASLNSVEVALAALLEAAGRLTTDTYLVLDDFHFVESEAVLEKVSFLLSRLPPPLHLLIASRSDPKLPLGRLRAQGQVLEIKPADLCFTAEETQEFYKNTMPLNLSQQQTYQLWARNEGWAAGIQLAGLSLMDRDGTRTLDFIRNFSGSQRYVLEYLAEEVLTRQPQEVQRFLLDTALLDRLNADLCEYVTGQSGGQVMLERLEKANLFLVPLDDEGEWFRYHHLFAQFLQARLKQSDPQYETELNCRAAQWYEQQGFINDAIKHLTAAKNIEKAAQLIEKNGRNLLMRGEIATLKRWLGSLPPEIVSANPELNLLLCWALTISWQVTEATALFRQVEKTAPAGDALAMKWLLSLMAGDFEELFKLKIADLDRLDEATPFIRSIRALVAGVQQEMAGNPQEAGQSYLTSSLLSRSAGNSLLEQIATSQVADQLFAQGQLHRAAATYQQALALLQVEDGVGDSYLSNSMVNQGYSLLLYEQNELEAAAKLLEDAIQFSNSFAFHIVLAPCLAQLALIKVAQGDNRGAQDYITQALKVSQRQHITWVIGFIELLAVRVNLALNNLEEVRVWAESLDLAEDADNTLSFWPIIKELRNIVRAKWYLVEGKVAEASELLERVEKEAIQKGRINWLLEIQTLQAAALLAQNKERTALAKLSGALATGEKEGFIQTFASNRTLLGNLLEKASANLEPTYRRKLLEACGFALPLPFTNNHTNRLSERELEVLKLVAADLSNQEIASQLVVGLSTVKTHLLHIYGKLGSRNRNQAVATARDQGLI